jgi:hypothetical protein
MKKRSFSPVEFAFYQWKERGLNYFFNTLRKLGNPTFKKRRPGRR